MLAVTSNLIRIRWGNSKHANNGPLMKMSSGIMEGEEAAGINGIGNIFEHILAVRVCSPT